MLNSFNYKHLGFFLSLYTCIYIYACGDAIENNIFHYFYVCPLFIRHRIQLFNSLRKFQDVLNLDILLKGSPILTVEENTEIFDAVHHFITGSRRFT